jgi:hypothetical protein
VKRLEELVVGVFTVLLCPNLFVRPDPFFKIVNSSSCDCVAFLGREFSSKLACLSTFPLRLQNCKVPRIDSLDFFEDFSKLDETHLLVFAFLLLRTTCKLTDALFDYYEVQGFLNNELRSKWEL